MQIWPAIDLCGGKCVRLQQGDYDRQTVFADDPAAVARRFKDEGASRLHLVDLDGARDGRLVNAGVIQAIVEASGLPCQLGGGIRDESTIRQLLEGGVTRLVIGTKALKQPDWFRQMCQRFAGKLALGIDARDGLVATDGWLETSQTPAADLAAMFAGEPIAAIVYTDIATDGMLAGPNLEAMDQMNRATSVPVIASGGVTTVEDVKQLNKIGVTGCIIGRALYEGKLSLAEAIAAAE